jgi:hypothetical protein
MTTTITATVGVALALWLALVFGLGAAGVFAVSAGSPPLPIFVGAVLPIAIYLLAYRWFSGFRDFVLRLDPRLATGVQAWRFGGFAFIALLVYDVLPGPFAWPAGLGDIAIGVTAPLFALALARAPRLATSRGFVVWNLLGVLDLVVAVGTGTVIAWFGIGGNPASMGPMAQLPLVLVPAFLVPVFLMLHLTALLQARHAS